MAITSIPQWFREFPGFPAADVPQWLSAPDWIDRSWRNDVCPFFIHNETGLAVWINWSDPAKREHSQQYRFAVVQMTMEREGWHFSTDDPFLMSDDESETLAVLIGETFAFNLKEEIPLQWDAMRRANALPPYSDPDSDACASHNFCDANMPMADAFKSVTGRDFIPDHGAPSEDDVALWNRAWEYAKATRLTASPEELAVTPAASAPDVKTDLGAQIPHGFIVTLETANFAFEAHGLTEEQANETMGRALALHAEQNNIPANWSDGYDFATHLFEPGAAWRDGQKILGE